MTDEEISRLANCRIFKLTQEEEKSWGGKWAYELGDGFYVKGFNSKEEALRRIILDLFNRKGELASLCYFLLQSHKFVGKLPSTKKKKKNYISETSIRA